MMKSTPSTHSKLTFFLDSKLHENLKVRLYYDEIRSQSEFFRVCVESYLQQDKKFMSFLDEYKVDKKVQSKKRASDSRKLRQEGERLLGDLALTEEDVQNIFDILEEELPEI